MCQAFLIILLGFKAFYNVSSLFIIVLGFRPFIICQAFLIILLGFLGLLRVVAEIEGYI
jgi:hypothetical protein